MGQIVSGAAKPKRCNINKLSQLGTPAAGEYILVSSDNSMNAAGQGNFDCYIEGDGSKAATALELKSLVDDGAFDISAYRATGNVLAKYVDLSAALDGGNNIPQPFRKGGMSIKFVQSSDNKYVQARCMAQNFTTDVTQWQGVDDEPTAGSKNLVKSGGVAKAVGFSYVNAYITNTKWVVGSSHRSFYFKVKKDSVITIAPNSNRQNEYVSFLQSVDINNAPVFTNGTTKAVQITGLTTFNITEDCYFLWIDKVGIIEDWSPSVFTIDSVSVLDIIQQQILSFYEKNRDVFNQYKDVILDIKNGCNTIVIEDVNGGYFNNNGTWVTTNPNHKCGYIHLNAGDLVKLKAGSDYGSRIAFVSSEPDVSTSLVFADGTSAAINISSNQEYTRTVGVDCYLIWIDKVYINGVIQNWQPQVVSINSFVVVNLYKNIGAEFLNIYTPLQQIKEGCNTVPIEYVNNSYFNNNGTWKTPLSEYNSCKYVHLNAGSTVQLKAGSDYGSRIAFVSSEPDVSTSLVFADGTSAAINISSNQEYTRTVGVDCYLIWINVILSSPQNWDLKELYVDNINVFDLYNNIGDEFLRIFADLKNITNNIDEISNEISKISNNVASYYQKGESPKDFSALKKICILCAGQSNADGRVPYADMPENIKNAQPIAECQIVRNSETAAFSALNITGLWAFDLITYYNLVTRANKDIYVIKWAVGGTSIDPQGDSDYHWTADYEKLPSLSYSLLWKFEREIRNHVASDGEYFDIRAILWHQGEGDRGSLGTGSDERYYQNLRNMIAYIRGIVGNERLPFITGTISHNSAQYDAKIEAAQYKIASEDPYYYLIDMSGATLLDSYHFDAVSTEYFGEMAYDKLIDAGVISGTKINPIAPWET